MQYPERTYTYYATPMGHLPQVEREAIADRILARYLAGDEIRDICKDLDISPATAYGLLVSCREETWKDISVGRALSRYAAAEKELDAVRTRLETASDSLELGKAREIIRLAEAQMKSASWQLEKLYRRLFGNDVPQPSQEVVHVQIGIYRTGDEKAAPVIEGEATSE